MKNINTIISNARFHTYYQVTDHDYDKAIELYQWNIKISASFYIIIQSLEISIRNSLLGCIEKTMPNWLKENSQNFLSMSDEQRRQVIKAIDKSKKRANSNKIIAELSFGFWVSMFSQRYVKNGFWNYKNLKEVLPNYSFNDKQQFKSVIKDIWTKMEKIREIRNRISHHEPIFNYPLDKIFDDLNWLLKSQSIDYKTWTDGLHDTQNLLKNKPVLND